jgi:hypothetical protein
VNQNPFYLALSWQNFGYCKARSLKKKTSQL